MEEFILIRPTSEYAGQISDYRQEFLDVGDSMDGCGPLRRIEDPEEYIKICADCEDTKTVPAHLVPATQFMLVRKEDNKVLGFLQVRHEFNDYLSQFGGHIGYSVRPSERRKGYAKEMLKMALPFCKGIGLNKVLITCVDGNIASEKTILENGGEYESTVYEPERKVYLKRFWVKTKKDFFEEILQTKDETERVNKLYEIFNEDARLNRSKAARVEFLTTVRYIEKYLKEGDKILDIGAGAGEYSLYFARKGYVVSALELADANIAAFKKKLIPEDKIDLVQGNALDLSRYADKSFDIVLLFGPLYHLLNDDDKQKCISEAKRVCRDGGKIFFSFISNDFVFLTEFEYDASYFSNGHYDKETFKLEDFPFVFHTVGAARKLLSDGGINILHEVASDGASELLADRINEMSDEDYAQYLRYHYYICEKPELLGMTNHLLFVGEKQ